MKFAIATVIFCSITLTSFGQIKATVHHNGASSAKSSELMPEALIKAKASEVMGDYDSSVDLYKAFMISSNDVRLLNYANEGIGFAYSKAKRYSDAMPFFTQYLSYYNNPAHQRDKYASNIGRAFVYRGFSRGMLGDHQSAITDLGTGINWLENKIKNSTRERPEYKEELGFAYLVRGLQKSLLPGSSAKDGCSDLRRASELGQERAFDYIKDYCN